jgi:signal transduction histidine kinase
MAVSGRRKSIAFFITLGACLVALAIALNVSWILLNVREIALLVSGIIVFALIITGLVLNTTFLIREIRRNEQHDAFINSVTHELKTPLASIRLYLQTLKQREINEDKRQEFYNVMLADSDRLMQTVDQVLRAGQSGLRSRKLNFRKVDIGQLARECVDLTRTRHNLPPDAVSFAESVNGERPQVKADADELRVALTNLLDNAVKYSVKDVQVAVEVATFGDKKVAVRIKDSGIGIPSGQLKRIFRRFYRVPGRVMARIKGTGLGLFIVSSVVQKHGGRVFAESEGPGQGSRFTIELPRL